MAAARDPADDLRRIAFLLERTRERDLPGAGVPHRGRRRAAEIADRLAAAGRGSSARCAAAPASARRPRPWIARVAGRRGARLSGAGRARTSRSRARLGRAARLRPADPGRGGAAGRAARRLPHPLGLVRRRLADPGDGRGRADARPRVPGAHRPLAPADRRQRAVGRAAASASSTSSPSSTSELAPFRILTGIEVDILDDGALDQKTDAARPARPRRGQRALQAADAGRGR